MPYICIFKIPKYIFENENSKFRNFEFVNFEIEIVHLAFLDPCEFGREIRPASLEEGRTNISGHTWSSDPMTES